MHLLDRVLPDVADLNNLAPLPHSTKHINTCPHLKQEGNLKMKAISTFSRLFVLASLTLGASAGSRPPRPIIIGNDKQANADALLRPGRGASEDMGCERMSACVPKSDWKTEGGCSPETQHVGVDFSDCQDVSFHKFKPKSSISDLAEAHFPPRRYHCLFGFPC
jgi:hypothetical protein